MPDYRPPIDDLKFVLNDVLRIGDIDDLPGFERLDADLVSSVVEEFGKFAAEVLGPLNAVGDREGVHLGPNGVETPPGFANAYRRYVEGGWPTLPCAGRHGGEGMPGVLYGVVEEMLAGANMAFAMCPQVSPGAYRVISERASVELQNRYLGRIVTGEWTAAMSLTEPQCGSALGLIATRAEPDSQGNYRITGTKIFNSWGDHDMADNIVHLVLARLPAAPRGAKGLSLFLVPKFLVGADGQRGQRNSFSVGGVETKTGIHASPTCTTNFEAATGYLIGEPQRGLENMFILMNSMRLATGQCAVGLASAAYEHALAYSRQRLAGRAPTGPQYPDREADPIIVHPDVRRMLMSMRAMAEGGRMLCAWVSLNLDLSHVHPDTQQRKQCDALVSLMVPVVKAFLTDKAWECTDLGVQCFGGWGVIREMGAEQYLRDVRFLRLGEGTSGIQALDFIARKVVADGARTLGHFFAMVQEGVTNLQTTDEAELSSGLKTALELVRELTEDRLSMWQRDPEGMAAVALDYLHLVGYLCLALMWAKMTATAIEMLRGSPANATFLQNKVRTARFYFAYVLPQIEALAVRIRAGGKATMAIPEPDF